MRLRSRLVLSALLVTAASAPAQQAPEPDAYRYTAPELVEESLERVLARPEFARLRVVPKDEEEEDSELPGWMVRLGEWLDSLLSGSGNKEGAPGGIRFGDLGAGAVLSGMAVVVLAAALFFLAKAALTSAREKKLDEEAQVAPLFGPGSAPGELAPADYVTRAQQLAARGEHKAAIGELLLAAMSALERGGLIRFRKGLTNRDYLRAAPRSSRESLQTLVHNFEHVYFGRREATAEGYDQCLHALRKSFSLEAT